MYYRCIRACPALWLILTFGVSFSLFGYAVYKHKLPSFEDPLVGFEVRHSELSSRLNTWKLLQESTALNGLLSLYPKPYDGSNKENQSTTATTKKPAKSKKPKLKKGKQRKKTNNSSAIDYDPFSSKDHQSNEKGFCGKLIEDYVHIVISTTDGSNLLELNALKNACNLDRFLLRMEHINPEKFANKTNPVDDGQFHFDNYCETKNLDQCCPSWSISNFILLQANKTDCDSLNSSDIDNFVSLLNTCSAFYADQYLNEDCATEPVLCPNVPEQCFSHSNLVFNVFHYLVDYRFLSIHDQIMNKNNTVFIPLELNDTRPFLKSSSIFLPMAKSSKLMAFYEAINRPLKSLPPNITSTSMTAESLTFGNVRIVAADLGLKSTLFSESLVDDLVLIIISSCIIFGSLLLYTRSLLLTLTAMTTNAASLASAYFLYMCLYNIQFFPFLNLLSVIILIGIGSDNALIYCKAWCCVRSSTSHTALSKTNRRHRNEYHAQMNDALQHVLVSSFCASLTTCCAFFAGYFSDITSLKCFSIFAGTLIITNFLITIIVFPSAILLSEKFSAYFCLQTALLTNNKLYNRFECITTSISNFLFNDLILKLVFNFRFIISATFLFIALGAGFIVLYSPGLQLPINQEFQVFSSRHLFERYDLKYRNEFWFSRFFQQATEGDKPANNQVSNVVLPIRVVFGVRAEDNGDALNPFNRGHLVFDPQFNISSAESQVWLLDFCRNLRYQPFYRLTMGPMLTNCFIETFKEWMDKRQCTIEIGGELISNDPCCEDFKFPYEPAIFNQCLVEAMESVHRTPNSLYSINRAGPRFNSSNLGTVMAFVIEYDSVYDAFSSSYQDMAKHWNTMDAWVREEIKTAPKGLQSGWFVTVNAEFFALQLSLSSGVTKSLLIAVSLAFVTLICTTWNIRLAFLSTISISCLIFTTIAALILLDWRLNVIESITISLTVGLAIDATLHYTIAYKLLAKGNRLLGIQMTLARIGSPVAMGAITTFLSGSIMLFSYILAYIQIGTFLMLLSVISWLYSTLFHLSVLAIFGAHHEKAWLSFDWFSRVKQFFSLKRFYMSKSAQETQMKSSSSNGKPIQFLLTSNNALHDQDPLSPTDDLQNKTLTLRRASDLLSETDGVCLRVTSV